MIIGSQIIDGDPTLWDPNLLRVLVVHDEAGARAAVRPVKAEGADFVKVYSRLSPSSYRAILDEARRQGLTVHGHGPDQVPIKTGDYNGWFRQMHPIEWIAANSFSRARAADVFGTFDYVIENLYKANRAPRKSHASGSFGSTGNDSSGSSSPTRFPCSPARTPVRRTWCLDSLFTRNSSCW